LIQQLLLKLYSAKDVLFHIPADMTTITFADALKHRSIDRWQKILTHRFIMELSSDILPPNKFVFYLRQDHYFLEEFSRFLNSAKQKTSDNKLKEWLDSLYLSTVNFEMKMQKQLLDLLASLSSSSNLITNAANHDIIIPSKTTFDYTCYLKHISSTGTFSEIVSVMAPCPWTYLEIADKLSKIGIRNEIFRNWVQFYSSNESRRQVEGIKQILNMLAEKENEKSKNAMENHFITACKYEYLFWEMAYRMGR
jgi:thiaminase (transcriptional activator TenA)